MLLSINHGTALISGGSIQQPFGGTNARNIALTTRSAVCPRGETPALAGKLLEFRHQPNKQVVAGAINSSSSADCFPKGMFQK